MNVTSLYIFLIGFIMFERCSTDLQIIDHTKTVLNQNVFRLYKAHFFFKYM